MCASASRFPLTFFRRVTASVPLLITVVVHGVLIAVAAYFVVSEQIIGKKKVFEAPPPVDGAVVQKRVEHRLQVARKGGGSASASPVSAARIYSTAKNALAMPALPELDVGASPLSGVGFGAGLGAAGMGTGYNTGLGKSGGLGTGFMSLSFLGTTSQKASKIVFALDVEPSLMDIKKGGYGAFKIIREQMMKLVGSLPPSAEFNVVVFQYKGAGSNVGLFAPALLPATYENKTRFGEWMGAINGNPSGPFGLGSVPDPRTPDWTLPAAVKLETRYEAPYWLQGVHAAIAQKPDTIYVISGSAATGVIAAADPGLQDRQYQEFKAQQEKQRAAIRQMGLDPDAVAAARKAAYEKARREFDELNDQLIAENKEPFVIKDINRIFEPGFQATLRKRGLKPITLDLTGWSDKQGKPINLIEWRGGGGWKRADMKDAATFISRLQGGYLPVAANIHLFYFTGAQSKATGPGEVMTYLAQQNGGRYQLLTEKRLEELAGTK